jgi:aryl-alcohol dehydrogenase-like predicted oxidoreductase
MPVARPVRGPGALVLGTVQFGLDYGISNAGGKVSAAAAREILAAAGSAGIDRVDTAAAYGDSEAVLREMLRAGSPIRVVTKAPKIINGDIEAALDRARRSADLFGPQRLDAILLHSASDLLDHGDALWVELERLKAAGLVDRIGFSAYAHDDPLALARRYRPDLVQVAASVFDQRLVSSGQIAGMASIRVEVHIRSIFLQGLVFMSPNDLPSGLSAARAPLERWRSAVKASGVSPGRAALDFALGIEGAARLVVGVTSPAELVEIVGHTMEPALDMDYAAFSVTDPAIVDPWRW